MKTWNAHPRCLVSMRSARQAIFRWSSHEWSVSTFLYPHSLLLPPSSSSRVTLSIGHISHLKHNNIHYLGGWITALSKRVGKPNHWKQEDWPNLTGTKPPWPKRINTPEEMRQGRDRYPHQHLDEGELALNERGQSIRPECKCHWTMSLEHMAWRFGTIPGILNKHENITSN